MYERDVSGWPIVVVAWRDELTDADLEGILADLDGWLDRNERFGLLIDARAARGTMSAPQRARVLAHMRANADRSGSRLVQAVVHDNPLMRGLYAAVSFVYPLPFPSKSFPDPEPARTWLVDKVGLSR